MTDIYKFNDIKNEATNIINSEVNYMLKGKVFNLSDCDFFIKKLKEKIGEKLIKFSNNFKYILNIIFLDNANKGFTQNIDAIYDINNDGILTLTFKQEKITCVVNLIGLSL